MKVDVIDGSVKWGSTMEKETMCEYYRPKDRGGCKCTSQTSCRKCRFIHPCSGFEKEMLRELAKVQKSENDELTADIGDLVSRINNTVFEHSIERKKLEDQILAMEIFESTHCGEF